MGEGDFDGVVGVVGGGATTRTEAVPETEPCVVAPLATPVTFAVRVTEPSDALLGTASWACSSVGLFAFIAPSVQVCVPSPAPQTVKVGAGKLLGEAETCTVTSVAAPPVGSTSILYWAGWPGCTVPVTAVTVTQSCVADEAAAADADAGTDAPPPGVRLGVGPGAGELGAVGSA